MDRGLPMRACAQIASSDRPTGKSGFIAVSPSVCRPLTTAAGSRIDGGGWRRHSAKLRIVELLKQFCVAALVRGVRKLLTTITAFTLAHSITSAAATQGFI